MFDIFMKQSQQLYSKITQIIYLGFSNLVDVVIENKNLIIINHKMICYFSFYNEFYQKSELNAFLKKLQKRYF